MPILAPEPMVSSNDLFTSSALANGRWWVFQTRAKAEKALCRLLQHSDVSYFLPTYTRNWKKGGRSFQSQLPLFPGYVFVAGTGDARLAALTTRLVVREVPVHDHLQLAGELSTVYTALTGDGSARPEMLLPRGQQVAVIEGLYAGITGTVMESSDGLRVCVEISLLGQGVSVVVDRWMLRPVNSDKTKNAVSFEH
jgi:transcription antitermination factor NusG